MGAFYVGALRLLIRRSLYPCGLRFTSSASFSQCRGCGRRSPSRQAQNRVGVKPTFGSPGQWRVVELIAARLEHAVPAHAVDHRNDGFVANRSSPDLVG